MANGFPQGLLGCVIERAGDGGGWVGMGGDLGDQRDTSAARSTAVHVHVCCTSNQPVGEAAPFYARKQKDRSRKEVYPQRTRWMAPSTMSLMHCSMLCRDWRRSVRAAGPVCLSVCRQVLKFPAARKPPGTNLRENPTSMVLVHAKKNTRVRRRR